MNIVIWGYGKNGKRCNELFDKYLINDKVICFIDNDRKKINDYEIVPVVSAGTLKILCENGLVDQIVVPGYEPVIYRSIFQQMYRMGIDYRKLFFYAELDYFVEKLPQCSSFGDLLKMAAKEIPLIGALEYEVSEKCNLNCKRCNHYSNIFKDGKNSEYDSFCKDIDAIRKLAYNIKRLKLLGGEPLLNPELYRFILKCREVFPRAYIAVITNGILLRKMSIELKKALRDTGAVVEISVYPPFKDKVEEVITFLEGENIKYRIFREGDSFGAYFNRHGKEDKMFAMMQCYAQVCHAFKNGKIYKCTSGMNIHVLNNEYGTDFPDTGIDLWENGELRCATDIMNYLINPVELCRFCTRFEYYPWEKTQNDASIEDWLVRDRDEQT